MNGERLYQLYTEANNEQHVGVDSWDDMTDEERSVWDRMAELLPDMPTE